MAEKIIEQMKIDEYTEKQPKQSKLDNWVYRQTILDEWIKDYTRKSNYKKLYSETASDLIMTKDPMYSEKVLKALGNMLKVEILPNGEEVIVPKNKYAKEMLKYLKNNREDYSLIIASAVKYSKTVKKEE